MFNNDDNKVSHKDPKVVTEVLEAISAHFGELSASRRTKHDFLRVNIEIKEHRVHINMREQVKEAIDWGNKQGGCKPTSPAIGQLFSRDEASTNLPTRPNQSG